jgi:hypothetical protein
MRKFVTFSIFAALILTASTIFAQSSPGKLAGRVTDAATGEALIGANIILLNTTQGSATDLNGDYFVLNITPGTYSVKFSFVGYSTKTITDVRIVPGVTYELNVELSSGIDLEEIVVTSEKLYEEKATNTVKVIDSEDIARLPVRGVENLASLQAGVVKSEGSGGAAGNATINVRGGRGSEVVYIIDGVVQNDPLFGTNNSQVSNAAVEQISFQVGGYEAKFGQAQSGIVNVTTKSGSPKYNIFGEAISSTFTDEYGYNLYNVAIGGPIIPGNNDHTFFASGERGWFLDGEPSAVPIEFPSIDYSSDNKPNNTDAVWRYTLRTNHALGADFNLQLGANLNTREQRLFTYDYAKNNSEHNPIQTRDVYSFTGKLSQNVGASSFWNMTLGYNLNDYEEGDGVYFDNLEAYGDTLTNPFLERQGSDAALQQDAVGIFTDQGKVDDYYRKYKIQTFQGNFNFTSQVGDHLLEAGFGGSYSIMRYYSMSPISLAINNREYLAPDGVTVIPARTAAERYELERPTRYGYDVFGNEIGASDSLGPNNPLLGYLYVQDRFELEDLVLNLGVRVDYFDPDSRIVKNPALPYAGGSDPNNFDDGDFIDKDTEFNISPRIGIGFPVTETTVFHAQYGKFVQEPRLIDLYPFQRRLDLLQQTADYELVDGYINSEITTQYEVGFRQIFGDNAAALNITAFYKNTEGLTNNQVVQFQRQEGGEILEYYTRTNSDFGTVKGLAFTLNVPRVSYFSLSLDYTYSIAEGTGSSSDASFVAAFRNDDGEIPKVIAPLSFDQRHTGVAILDFYVPKGELGFLEMTGINALISFASGRPYTPLETQNLLQGSSNWGDTKGYVNSAVGPGSFRVDLRVEKSIPLGESLLLTPYAQIENLFDADNIVRVWRSTGSAYTTNYLETEEGKRLARQNGEDWVNDYESLERDPANFGIPRLIKLGFKVNFSGI